MDITTIGGLLIALAAIVANVYLEGGNLSHLFEPAALLLILGGTVGATLIGFRKRDVSKLGSVLVSAFTSKPENAGEMVNRLVSMAEKARREGLLSLQDEALRVPSPLLSKGLTLVVDGTDPEVVVNHLETQLELDEERVLTCAQILEAAGGYSPTIGIIGTVMGLVNVLGNLGGDSAALGEAIAMAFLATFYGIAFANLVWLPLASKVKQNAAYENRMGRMYITGIVGLQTGEAPRALRGRLEAFLDTAGRKGDES